MASEELIKKRQHLKALEDFIGGPGYVGFIAYINEEIRQLNERILIECPTDIETVFAQLGDRGERRCFEAMLTVFENGVEELKDRISELEDEETLLKGGR
jgi:hypothetical protein